tara:strand:+ start:1832 stop:2179 length:348 start_codon:yes stop_codon:yes gene_type:complete
MTVRLLDESGDIVTSGKQFTTGATEVAQTVATRLRLYLGEDFRNIQDGTPWWESILGKEGTLSSKEAIIKNRIIRTDGVTKILSFTTDFDISTRAYSVKVGILTKYGETELTVSV